MAPRDRQHEGGQCAVALPTCLDDDDDMHEGTVELVYNTKSVRCAIKVIIAATRDRTGDI